MQEFYKKCPRWITHTYQDQTPAKNHEEASAKSKAVHFRRCAALPRPPLMKGKGFRWLESSKELGICAHAAYIRPG